MQNSVSPQYTLPQPEQLTPQAFLQEVKTTLDAAGVAYTDIVLFGSRARGTHHEWSDYDVLIVVPSKLEREARWTILRKLTQQFSDRLIPFDTLIYSGDEFAQLKTAGVPLVREIEQDGLRI